ncbi:ArsR/SmtB family transcription factor [Rhodopirellula sp. MGV]|uniref:ArsR/SmtB family transcription factor n=1 Tax=Rhodopirellula sp. MGV TaxID=2023130 RepID=UPI000B968885|nr:metalloregulator ArsR/SmtB family transcription factor [Rhodopirellula sp. MGV]OYP30438.1 transcriptional regulator [Rhodopirellula sp. MGV]PNY34783.1 transcriptional regulator [Rhodopirellula baltica]
MSPTPTNTDVFTAIAEPKRREIVSLLAKRGPLPVGTMVDLTGLAQSSVSKHLGVLHDVGMVSVDRQGKQRIYKLEANSLKTVFEWVKEFESHWDHQLARIKAKAEQRAKSLRESN